MKYKTFAILTFLAIGQAAFAKSESFNLNKKTKSKTILHERINRMEARIRKLESRLELLEEKTARPSSFN